jgi:hypothetical protein
MPYVLHGGETDHLAGVRPERDLGPDHTACVKIACASAGRLHYATPEVAEQKDQQHSAHEHRA